MVFLSYIYNEKQPLGGGGGGGERASDSIK